MRSSARKSGKRSVASASRTTPSVTSGKSWPLATICVPTSTPRGARSNAPQHLGRAARRRRRGARRAGPPRRSSCSSRSVPAPWRATRHRPALRAARRHARAVAAVVAGEQALRAVQHERDVARPGTSTRAPHERQVRKFDQPRRLSSTIALRASCSAVDGLGVQRGADAAHVEHLDRRQPRPSTRSGRRTRAQRVRRLRPRRRAAADERRPAPLGDRAARRSAGRPRACRTGRAPRRRRSARGRRSARTPPSAGRRRRAPRRGAGAATRRSARPWTACECSTATVSPKRSTKRATICGVSAISGTSTIAPCAAARAPPRPRRGRPRSCPSR